MNKRGIAEFCLPPTGLSFTHSLISHTAESRRLSWPGWLITYGVSMLRKRSHFSTNRAGRKVTSLIRLCRCHYPTPPPKIGLPDIPLSDWLHLIVLFSIDKPGGCEVPKGVGTCVSDCSSDDDCTGELKCCFNGCGQTCQTPGITGSNYFTFLHM